MAVHREAVKAEWKRELVPFLKTYDLMPKATEILYRLVTNTSPEFYRSEYQRLTTQHVPYRGSLEYDYTLLTGIVLESITKKDLKELQQILKVNCPLYVTNRPLEYLVVAEFGPDAFEMFFVAFDTAMYEATKQKLFELICRAFHGDRNTPTTERVRLAKAYYDKWRKRFRLNRQYINNDDLRPELFVIEKSE